MIMPARFLRKIGKRTVVSIGHDTGIAEIGGRIIDGLAGWVLWRVVHLARMRSIRYGLATALDWASALSYDVDTARLEIGRPEKAA